MQDHTKRLADFVHGLEFSALPDSAVERTGSVIADWYASCFAGMRVNSDFNSAVLAVILAESSVGDASVLCHDAPLSEGNAAFMNAIYAHGADMDDGNKAAMGHIAAHVISAVMAVAETQAKRNGVRFSGKELITAVNAGYEVFNRVASAAQPDLVHRGFHSTGMAGGIACAAAAAKLIGLDADGIYNAMSLGAVQSSGLLLIAESGQSCKPINPANAAKNGIFSARLAEKGVVAPLHPLESKKGWFHAVADTVDLDKLTEGLGAVFTVEQGYLKPYPSCRHTHAPLDAALHIRRALTAEYGESLSDIISSVTVYTYPNAISVAGQITTPKNDGETKFSIHYAVAKALEQGAFGLDQISVSRITDDCRRLIGRIQLVEDRSAEDIAKGRRGARVEIRLADGKCFEHSVSTPRGEGNQPLSASDMRDKLYDCAKGILSRERCDVLLGNIARLDKDDFVSVNHLIFGE